MENFKEFVVISKIRDCFTEIAMIRESWFEALDKMKECLYDDQTEYNKWLECSLYYENEYLTKLEEKYNYILYYGNEVVNSACEGLKLN